VKVHLDQKLALVADTGTGLYNWAISELGPSGRDAVRDKVPFSWGCYFHASAVEVLDAIELKSRSVEGGEALSNESVAKTSHSIRVSLIPGMGPTRRDPHPPTYSMMGTSRIVKNIELHILPENSHLPLGCTCWGMVSYSDSDDGDHDDLIIFYLTVSPDEYARYEAKLTRGWANSIIFSASMVQGFYADWSPDVQTRHIKVLTASSTDQPISVSDDAQIVPNRLGRVGSATLSVNSRLPLQT
jgi:hypothetical protein